MIGRHAVFPSLQYVQYGLSSVLPLSELGLLTKKVFILEDRARPWEPAADRNVLPLKVLVVVRLAMAYAILNVPPAILGYPCFPTLKVTAHIGLTPCPCPSHRI